MPQSEEQRAESRRLGGRNAAARHRRYPPGHPKAGKFMPRGEVTKLDPPPPDPVQRPPGDPEPPPDEPPPTPRGGLNPFTATPRDLVDRMRGR